MIRTDMSAQEAFDIVVRGLASQGWKQSRRGTRGSCVYRSPDGLKCAAGWLIPDEKYDSDMEGKAAVNLFSEHQLRSLLDRMQLAHDAWDEVVDEEIGRPHPSMSHAFLALAEREGLTWPADVPKPEGVA